MNFRAVLGTCCGLLVLASLPLMRGTAGAVANQDDDSSPIYLPIAQRGVVLGSAPEPAPSPVATATPLSCGEWRWDVKTLSDPGAPSVNFTPQASTVHQLVALPTPASLNGTTPRQQPHEFQTYLITASLEAFKLSEDDQDIHLSVYADDNGVRKSMIIEIPDVRCEGATASFKRAEISAARTVLENACGKPAKGSYRNLAGEVVLSGVAFFDFNHGQRGVADNAIELHPVLKIENIACRRVTPTPAPTRTPTATGIPSTQTSTLTPTASGMATRTRTPTTTPTASPTVPTNTPGPTFTRTWTPSPSRTATTTPTPLPTASPTPAPANLVIGYLMCQGTDEYVRITNLGGTTNLSGWKILSVTGSQTFSFPNRTLAAGESVEVHSGPDAPPTGGSVIRWTTAYIWNNNDDRAELISPSGSTVDTDDC